MPWASLLLGEASAGDMSLVFPERCCWGLTRPNRAPRPVRLLHPQLLHQGSLGAESRTVLARAWPSPLFPRAPLPPQKPVPWAKELGRVTAMEVLPAAQEEAQCWETGLRELWGGRAGSAGGGGGSQGPPTCPQAFQTVRSAPTGLEVVSDASPLRGSSVMLKSISLGHDRLLPVCKEGPGGGH